jgi:hypothetical protein
MGAFASSPPPSALPMALRTLGDWFDEMKDELPVQNLIVQVTESNLAETSAVLLRDHCNTSTAAIFLVQTILRALEFQQNSALLATLFTELCAQSPRDLVGLALEALAPTPFESLDPLIEWSHLTFFHFLLQSATIAPDSIVQRIRAFCDDYPECLVAKLVFFCFFGREISAADPALDAALHAEFSMARESATKPLHPALAEFFDQSSDDLVTRWIESRYFPGSLAQVLKDDDVNTLS